MKRSFLLSFLTRARRYSIRSRISLALILVVAIFIPITLASLYYVNQLFNTVEELVQRNAKFARAAEQMQVNFLQARRAEKNFLLTYDDAYVGQHKQRLERIGRILAELQQTAQGDDARELAQLENQLALYHTNASLLFTRTAGNENRLANTAKARVLEFRKQLDKLLREAKRQERRAGRKPTGQSPAADGGSDQDPYQGIAESINTFEQFVLSLQQRRDPEAAQLLTSLQQIDDQVSRLLDSIIARNWRHLEENRQQAELLRARALRNVTTGLMVTFLIAAFLFITLPNRIVEPIRRLTGMARRMRQGKAVEVAEVELADEVGELAVALDQLLAHYHRLDQLKSAKIAERTRALELLLDQFNEAVVIVDRECRIHQWSPAMTRLVPLPPSSLAGQSICSLLRLPPAEAELFEEMLRVGVRRTWSVNLGAETGEPRKWKVLAIPTTDEPQPSRIVLFFQPAELETVRP